MDDLISRKALIDDLCQDREEGTFDFTEKQAEAADKIVMYVNSRIEAQSPVPAVPLDKLCEWLEDNAALTDDVYISAKGWKRELTLWMEEQNA